VVAFFGPTKTGFASRMSGGTPRIFMNTRIGPDPMEDR
jgi:hypothetical protein